MDQVGGVMYCLNDKSSYGTTKAMNIARIGRRSGGFTIVELLIVIVVIGILAAITIVAFNGIQERARDTAIQSDLRGFNSAMQQHKALHGSYPATPTVDMGIKFTREMYGVDGQSPGYNARYCRDATNDQYVILVNSASGKYFKFNSIANKIEPAASTYGWGVCALLGLSETNPQANGKSGSTWAAWVN